MENQSNEMVGERFGKLVVLSPIKVNKVTQWLCICDCGEKTIVTKGNLLLNHTRSCGCLRKQPLRIEQARICFSGTNIEKIKTITPYKNSKTGCRGVLYRKDIHKYAVSIRLRGKLMHLGFFVKLTEAIEARRTAEEKYYKPIIELYKRQQEESSE